MVADIGDVLSSPVWTVLATIFALAAIVVSIWLYARQRTKKSLGSSIKVTELVSVHDEARGRIRLSFGDEEISQVHLVEARIENTGNAPVTDSDFEQPIFFEMGDGPAALTIETVDLTSPDLKVSAFVYKTGIGVAPMLLNPGDGFTVKALVRDLSTAKVECHYRIVGITKMDNRAPFGGDPHQDRLSRFFIAVGQASDRRPLLWSALPAAAGLVAIGVVLATLPALLQNQHSETSITVAGGKTLCGEVLQTGERKMIVQLKDSGAVHSLPISSVKTIEYNDC